MAEKFVSPPVPPGRFQVWSSEALGLGVSPFAHSPAVFGAALVPPHLAGA